MASKFVFTPLACFVTIACGVTLVEQTGRSFWNVPSVMLVQLNLESVFMILNLSLFMFFISVNQSILSILVIRSGTEA